MTSLTIIRGLPGTGKTTHARALAAQTGALHRETDQYLSRLCGHQHWESGEYTRSETEAHIREWLPQAIAWVYAEAESALASGQGVIISGVFNDPAKLAPYRALANRYGAEYLEIILSTVYGSVHGVTAADVARLQKE